MALISRLLASRIFRFGFVALTLAFAAWYIVGHWSGIRSGLDSTGLPAACGALACALIALVFTMLVWRALMAGLGSPRAPTTRPPSLWCPAWQRPLPTGSPPVPLLPFTSTGTAKSLRRPRLQRIRHYCPLGRIRRQLVLDRSAQ
jgi:hypothetical protein